MRILIIGPSWVGDMVMAQTLFHVLKQRHPACVIDVLAPEWSRPILERMPEVRQALSFPLGHGALELATRRRIGKSLAGQYDQAILLPNSLKSALVPFFAGIAQRTGWRGELRYGLLNDVRTLDKARYPLMIERFMALGYPAGAELPKPYPRPSLQIETASRDAALAKFGLSLDRPVLALCPGAEFGEAKRWPSEHYAKVAEIKIREGWQVWLFGSKNDHAVGESIREWLIPGLREESVNLSGETSLAEAIDLLSCSDAVVSNDSGLMHVAAALNRPLVAVYGSTSPGFTPPLADQVEVVRLGLECSPCFDRTCRFGHYNCLRLLEPEAVASALQRLNGPSLVDVTVEVD
ncbi:MULTISPECIES: lipopolysaccharide heptosyltransferase II [Pseudomonas]|jgi:heptosyltransferase-2|uniref:lipopolysaccharide heptosyltransferase II n=1 Tax=Pseudomonas qingdaonensis TaxID=2056231 RepID=A0ABX8DTF6_9PSED|nr:MULTISPECIES: lipopolysaccharide heptosyltransferase II [Pseudomonas]KIU46113.1 ADP-heptose--LPS heptosyltransferase [Pseudomonas putida]KTC18977.1 ADP-heptose--LPS heptosyltransferase [Pseudomonas putida]MBG8558080.1 lipopolysaccharide heptosyltransferase II [Pseudomonas qingdaonensis]MCO7502755.1 lipopolysaccharide heptosyltransferase II [Pseudomonas sp. VE 267-6A]MCO7530420.1 lipopolysaccharide heptosyltransferase II [Pseudomonas sp. 2]